MCFSNHAFTESVRYTVFPHRCIRGKPRVRLRFSTTFRWLLALLISGMQQHHTHQSDLFHCKHTIMPELLKLETQCYSLINKEEQARQKLEKRKAYCKDIRGAVCTLRAAKKTYAEKIGLFDHL